MLTKKEMAEKWGLSPIEPIEGSDKSSKKQKKSAETGLAKVKERDENEKKDDSVGDFADLIDKSRKAELEQEISKAETMKYKAEQERLKLMKQSGEVMAFDKGDMLFFGFIEKGSIESLRVTKKLQARIKNLCDENDPKGIMNIIDRELENIFMNIQEEQREAVENWQKTLK